MANLVVKFGLMLVVVVVLCLALSVQSEAVGRESVVRVSSAP